MLDANNFSNSNDAFDPEFLTFRHNSPQSQIPSGRSIYSQRFDYKSLQKYPIFDTHNSERDDINQRTHKKIKHTIKQKHLRTVKSQDKYRQLFPSQNYNAEQKNSQSSQNQPNYSQFQSYRPNLPKVQHKYQTSIPNSTIHKKQSKNNQNNQNSQQQIQKNLQLKSKLTKLIRNMKKQQRKQSELQTQIQDLTKQLQTFDKQIQQQTQNITQLQQIYQQNMNECNRIIQHINKASTRNQQIAINLQNLQQSVDSQQVSIQTTRQDQVKDKLICTKLKENIGHLNKIKGLCQNKINRLQEEIKNLQIYMEQLKNCQNQMLRIFGFNNIHNHTNNYNNHTSNNIQLNNNHKSNYSHSQNQSHNSSNGSNRQSLYYT